ncbi:hypothetical protein PVAND_017288 [Polypedilum vanderplanki]|uniref:F-box domain-containing protein n=1 Tax=Polypedilum vanderplanki TaxID=319348 RepID=A0A9J6BHN2_POLVA|nr:hypothetical protein PVAND_017288 [Polypedilum vanderplanki]
MDCLPKEILIEIFSHLDGYSLFHAAKVCQSWSDTINHSVEITSKFSYKIHTGANSMPDYMDLQSFSNLQFNFNENEDVKIIRFWPNKRITEVCDIIDGKGKKINELLNIFYNCGISWKEMNFHDVKLQKISDFENIFETFVNCRKLNLTRCSVEDVSRFDKNDEVLSDGHCKFEAMEVTKVEWCIWKALKCFRNLKYLKVSSSSLPSTEDFHKFLINCKNLTELSLFGSSKYALVSSFPFKFKLQKLVIDRSNNYHDFHDTNCSNLNLFWKFLFNQNSSLKKLKFKGKISQEMILKIANQMNLKVLNLHFVNADGRNQNFSGNATKNFNLEKLHCVGNAEEIEGILKYFPAIKSLKLNGSSFKNANNLMPRILQSTPQLTVLKVFQPIEIPSELDHTLARFHQLEICRIYIPNSKDVTRFLRLCPNLKKITILTQFTGEDLEEILNESVENLNLVVQNLANIFDVADNIFRLFQCLPKIKKLSLNSMMCGRILITPIILENLEKVKIDFTSTNEQCNNMYELLKRCPNIKSIEISSKLLGKFEVDENFKFQNLQSLSLLGIDKNFAAFENLMKIVKISPKLQKLNFWIREKSDQKYFYGHDKELKNLEIFDCSEMQDLNFSRFRKSELKILLYLLKCFKNLQYLKIGIVENFLTDENLALVLENCENLEKLSLGENFIWTGENLKITKEKLKNLKRLEIFAKKPLKMQEVLREIFGDKNEIEFVINPNCLEEWKEDEIVKI